MTFNARTLAYLKSNANFGITVGQRGGVSAAPVTYASRRAR